LTPANTMLTAVDTC